MVADIIAPKLHIIFHGLIRRRTFLKCWQFGKVTSIPKGAPVHDRENECPISITPILSIVYKKLVSHKLSSFCLECYFCLLLSLIIEKVWAASHHLQKSIDTGMDSYIVQLDFSAAFHRVSHSGLLFKLKSIGVGRSVLSIFMEFLSNHRQRVIVDGVIRDWISIVSGVPQGSVLGPLLFILYTSEMFELVGNRLYAFADDSVMGANI